MIPREVQDFQKIKELFKLSDKQKAVLIGTLLGDGSLKRRGIFHRLHIKHSNNQLNFVKYKRDVFSNITCMKVRKFSQKVKGKIYKFSEFVTLTHPEFTKYYNIFYPNGKKKITNNVLNKIKNPLSLALWFMDDGCAEYAGLSFNTQCFTKREVELLRICLKDEFNIDTTKRRNKNGWIIYVPKLMLTRFRGLVENHILSDFKYKLIPHSTRL